MTLSILFTVLTCWLIGCGLGFLLGTIRECESCFASGKSAGLGEADGRIGEIEAEKDRAIAGRDEEIRSWIRTMNERDDLIKDLRLSIDQWHEVAARRADYVEQRDRTIAGLHAEHARLTQEFDEKCELVAGLTKKIEVFWAALSRVIGVDDITLAYMAPDAIDKFVDEHLNRVTRLESQAKIDDRGFKDLGAKIHRLEAEARDAHATGFFAGQAALTTKIQAILAAE